ncbi:hypothetical protein LTR96_011883, partial [Exophiala xenobiotica]
MVNSRAGSWILQGVRFSTTAELPYWTYLALCLEGHPVPWNSEQTLLTPLDDFTNKLKELASRAIKSAAYTSDMTVALAPPFIESHINDAIHKFMYSVKRSPARFLLIMLPSRDTRIYNPIKYVCDIKEGVLN